MVNGRPAADRAATIASRFVVTRWLARRRRTATVSRKPSDAVAPVAPAMCAVYGDRVAASRAGTFRPMDATERFTELVRLPPDDVPLDEAALLIAAHAHPELDIAGPFAELDRLAGG